MRLGGVAPPARAVDARLGRKGSASVAPAAPRRNQRLERVWGLMGLSGMVRAFIRLASFDWPHSTGLIRLASFEGHGAVRERERGDDREHHVAERHPGA